MRIIVAGSGPAGVVTASKLASLGHDVTILAVPQRNASMEGLSFRVLEGLRAAGLSEVLADLEAPVMRQSCWNGSEQSAGREWLAERSAFDARLTAAARKFATVHRAHLIAAARGSETIRAAIEAPDGTRSILSADFLVDARGRTTPVGGPRLTGPETAVLCRRYDTGMSLPPSTWLETGPEGWAWLAVPRTGCAYLQITVAAARGSLPGRPALKAHFETLKAGFPGILARLHRAEPVGPLQARLATAGVCAEPAKGRYARVGDAAIAVDPLSGHGIFEAVAGAFAAAATINTILHRPKERDLAYHFYRERTLSTFWARARSGRTHYRGEERWPRAPFWMARQGWPHTEAPAAPPQCAIARRAVIDDGWIRECEVIVTPEQPRGVWRLDGVPVVSLWKLLASGQIDGAEAAANAFGVSAASAAAALAWLARINLPGPRLSD